MTEHSPTQINVSQEQTHKLEELVEVSPALLFEARTVFPFRIFPAYVTLSRTKLTVTDYLFFFTKEVKSIMIKDIIRVDVQQSFFLGSVSVVDRAINTEAIHVAYLWYSDALKLRRLLEGLIIAEREGVDIKRVSDHDVAENIETLGTTTEETPLME